MGKGLTGRRVMRLIATGKPVGSVAFDGSTLKLEGQAAAVLGHLRGVVDDDKTFGEDLLRNGWANMAVELGPLQTERKGEVVSQ